MLKQELEKQEINYRFFWIGFSASHDAELLGTIARSGNDLGNFIFIDDNNEADIQIQNALNQVFDLTPDKSSLFVKIFENIENGFEQKLRLNNIEGSDSILSASLVLPSSVIRNKHKIKIECENETIKLKLTEVVPDSNQPTKDIVDYIHIHLFALAERVQTQSSK